MQDTVDATETGGTLPGDLDLADTVTLLERNRDAHESDGTAFHRAVLKHATSIPQLELEKVWQWKYWPNKSEYDLPFPDEDRGIDLVGRKHDGSFVAIQCKAKSGENRITSKEVQKFAGVAPVEVFAERWMTAEGKRSKAVEDDASIAGVDFVDFLDLMRSTATAQAQKDGTDPRDAVQAEAVAKCVETLREPQETWRKEWIGRGSKHMPDTASRCVLVMPCGTGKTRVSAQVVLELSNGKQGDICIVLVPSIALIAQVRSEYLSYLTEQGVYPRTLAVCSDTTAGHPSTEDRNGQTDPDPTVDRGAVRTSEINAHHPPLYTRRGSLAPLTTSRWA